MVDSLPLHQRCTPAVVEPVMHTALAVCIAILEVRVSRRKCCRSQLQCSLFHACWPVDAAVLGNRICCA